MARKFEELRRKMGPERTVRNAREAQRALLEMTLQDIRQKLTSFSQEDIAEMLDVTQGYVSRLERQEDMLLSNLYAYVKALGGQLEIRARFAGREVEISQFSDLEKLRAELAPEKPKRSA